MILANSLALVADVSFNSQELSFALAWLGAIAYTFQIYFDFSGYSDMAIGLGKIFGFSFLENFNYPYISTSISEFWRRWHISLGTWFRDYVYIPLGGSRTSKGRHIFNLLTVWTLTGIWHGANWTFLIWGLIYFCLISLEALNKNKKKIIKPLGHIYALFWIIIGWVFFRANSLLQAFNYILKMFGIGVNGLFDDNFLFYFNEYKYYLLFAIISSMPIKTYITNIFLNKISFFVPYIFQFLISEYCKCKKQKIS
jgi:D-alanyl-lipoteichoic acid acyltransferase DltB (MBOAT superfamily)